MTRVFCILCAALVLGCGTLPPPQSFIELKKMVESADADDQRYVVARQHLRHAATAIEENDEADANRFSELGLIEARIAMTSIRQTSLIERTEKESARKQQLELETAQWQSKVDELLQQQARGALRTHIEAVIRKSVLEAAAQEEIQSHMGDVTSATLEQAQSIVGRELAAMASVRLEIARLLVEKGILIPEQLQQLEGHVLQLLKANKDDDLALAYQHAEKSLMQFLICWDDAWMLSGKEYATTHAALLDSFSELDIAVVKEEAGDAATIFLQSDAKKAKLSDDNNFLLEKAVTLLHQHEDVHLLIWVSGTRAAAGIARRQSTTLAGLLKEKLASLDGTMDGPNSRISIFQLDGERPLNALVGQRPQGALLFVPLP